MKNVDDILSLQDYERMRKINIEDFQQFRKRMGIYAKKKGLSEADLNKILSASE